MQAPRSAHRGSRRPGHRAPASQVDPHRPSPQPPPTPAPPLHQPRGLGPRDSISPAVGGRKGEENLNELGKKPTGKRHSLQGWRGGVGRGGDSSAPRTAAPNSSDLGKLATRSQPPRCDPGISGNQGKFATLWLGRGPDEYYGGS